VTETTAHHQKLDYIEGLRGLSILLVVAAHVGSDVFAGGYIGVDVFFVISGFLITRIIVGELSNSGRFRYARFYLRRVKRLLPALLLMTGVTCAVAFVMLAPMEQTEQAGAAGAASLWVSNFFFLLRDTDYFSPAASSNLFLHTWSLGVEEQFYLVWPVLLSLFFVIGGVEKHKAIKRLKVGLYVILAISLAACILITTQAPDVAFYMMPFRAWQFAVGGLVGLRFSPKPLNENDFHTNHVSAAARSALLGLAGILFIIGAAVAFGHGAPYPGWRAVVPTVGTAMIIVAIQNGGSTVAANRILTIRPLLLLGTVSYSWYLWHWPTINLLETAIAEPKIAHRVLFAAISLVIAAVSYRFVENPIRRSQLGTLRPMRAVVGAVFAAGIIYAGTGIWQSAAKSWSELPSQRLFEQARWDKPRLHTNGCDGWYHDATVRPCTFGNKGVERQVVIFGDSIIAQWFRGLAPIYARSGYNVTVITKSACPIVDAQTVYRGSRYVVCEQWRNEAIRTIERLKPEVVIVGSGAGYADIGTEVRAEYTYPLMRRLSGATEQLLIFAPTPILEIDGHICEARSAWRKSFSLRNPSCEWNVTDERHVTVTDGLKHIANNLPNAYVIDLNPVVCPESRCRAMRDGVVVFRNGSHITSTFAAAIAPNIAEVIQRALVKR
jgi:peptidoglycan/LPS O-acetylase OafA/YrhL